MVKRRKNKNQEIYLKAFKRLLELSGKPFYFLIFGFTFLLYLIGHSARLSFEKLLTIKITLLELPEFPEIELAKIRKAKLKKYKQSLANFVGKKTKVFKLLNKSLKKINLQRLPKFKINLKFNYKKNKNYKEVLKLIRKYRKKSKKIKFPEITFPKLKIKLPKILLSRKKKVIAFVSLLLIIFVFSSWYFVFRDLPSPHELTNRKIQLSTKIYDRNGILLYQIYKNQNRSLVPLSSIPSNLKTATLAAEDAEFYRHPGFSIKGIVRAVFTDTTKGQLSGGSTITQQLVKNALLTPEKSIVRKIREIVLSIEVELTYSKDQILEMYLNEVSYGGSSYGIEEASRVYFGKDVSKLTLPEAALLAGLPKSPTTYSPYGANPDLALEREKEVLRLMADNGFITKQEKIDAQNSKITFAPNTIDIKAPHFVMYVKDQLVEVYGEDVVNEGGLNVVTTLDYGIQKMAEEVVKNQIDKLKGYHVTNGAVVVLNPETGEILAMIGSKDYFDIKNDGNVNVTTALRQPGSSIKIVNYAYALSHGFTPATIISDTPTKFAIAGQPVYEPKNYDSKFRGNITLRSALAESRNIPAVKILASYGVDKMIELGHKMGITTWKDPSLYGLSLTLGGGETRLLDLANVFATIANSGNKPILISILKITDSKNKTLLETTATSEPVLDPRVAYMLIDILKDNNARSPAFGSYSALVIPKHPEVVVKTGTSNDLKDNLTVGFNQKYLTAVWVGNNDGSGMYRIASGVTGAAPIWNEIMSRLLATEASISWQMPSGLATVAICTYTATLPCEGCPTRSELFLEGMQPKYSCNSSQIAKLQEVNKSKDLDTGD